ncbi:MAG TPA: hypothetical protein VGJ91_22215, partial [Polyangiaceae bacterium]
MGNDDTLAPNRCTHAAGAVDVSEPAMQQQAMTMQAVGYQVRFQSLFDGGRALCFPCDREGHVDLDALSPQARGDYLFARAMVGREFTAPTVVAC